MRSFKKNICTFIIILLLLFLFILVIYIQNCISLGTAAYNQISIELAGVYFYMVAKLLPYASVVYVATLTVWGSVWKKQEHSLKLPRLCLIIASVFLTVGIGCILLGDPIQMELNRIPPDFTLNTIGWIAIDFFVLLIPFSADTISVMRRKNRQVRES